MSLATAYAPTSARTAPASASSVASAPALAPALSPAAAFPARRAAPLRAVPPLQSAPALQAVPDGPEARGFVLYVGVDEAKAAAAGIDLKQLVIALKTLTNDLVPDAQTHAAVALAPRGAGGRDVDVVRLALQDPTALAEQRGAQEQQTEPDSQGVVIDLSRRRVSLEGEGAALTFKEYELLQYLVLREGRTIPRSELVERLWQVGTEDEAPNERTIDVHVRRLRSKLGAYEDIVRTVRGAGYRFDRHPDVSVRHSSTPSPDFV